MVQTTCIHSTGNQSYQLHRASNIPSVWGMQWIDERAFWKSNSRGMSSCLGFQCAGCCTMFLLCLLAAISDIPKISIIHYIPRYFISIQCQCQRWVWHSRQTGICHRGCEGKFVICEEFSSGSQCNGQQSQISPELNVSPSVWPGQCSGQGLALPPHWLHCVSVHLYRPGNQCTAQPLSRILTHWGKTCQLGCSQWKCLLCNSGQILVSCFSVRLLSSVK